MGCGGAKVGGATAQSSGAGGKPGKRSSTAERAMAASKAQDAEEAASPKSAPAQEAWSSVGVKENSSGSRQPADVDKEPRSPKSPKSKSPAGSGNSSPLRVKSPEALELESPEGSKQSSISPKTSINVDKQLSGGSSKAMRRGSTGGMNSKTLNSGSDMALHMAGGMSPISAPSPMLEYGQPFGSGASGLEFKASASAPATDGERMEDSGKALQAKFGRRRSESNMLMGNVGSLGKALEAQTVQRLQPQAGELRVSSDPSAKLGRRRSAGNILQTGGLSAAPAAQPAPLMFQNDGAVEMKDSLGRRRSASNLLASGVGGGAQVETAHRGRRNSAGDLMGAKSKKVEAIRANDVDWLG